MAARITDNKGNWFNIWFEDKKWIISIMHKNMTDDIAAGYDPAGHAIRKQLVDIEEYTRKMNRELDMFKTMEDNAVDRWCYYDLKKRGAIE